MDLSAAKQALLEKWLKGQSGNPENHIPRRPEGSPVPLSFPQQRQLFLELLEPDTAVNNLSVLLDLQGDLDPAALLQSTNHIIERHEALRTRFVFGSGMPAPEILHALAVSIPCTDLSHLDPAASEPEAQRLAEREVLRPFNLNQAPLLRLRLFKLDRQHHQLLVVVHHAIADGWSLGVFLRELVNSYQQATTGHSLPLPTLTVQYGDYAYWQTATGRMASMQPSLDYWTHQLAGDLPVLELPTDKPRGSRQTFGGGTYRFTLSPSLTAALEHLSRMENATLFMTLLSAYTLLLHRYSGQDEIMVGTPVSNRHLPELEPMIGVFINTLVLRNHINGQASFRELLQATRKNALDAYAHQDIPFEKLVSELKPRRDLSRTPFFQAMFNWLNAPMPDMQLPGLTIHPTDIDRGVSQFDLTLLMSKSGGQCHAAVEYNSDLFLPETIERIFGSFQMILEQAVTAPDRPMAEIKITTNDWLRLLATKHKDQSDFPREKCMHQLFEEQCSRIPQSTAVICGKTSLTYRTLNRQANHVANQLAGMSAGQQLRVGILMERSAEMVTALLGVLKAGGTYVPIHTSFPDERVAFILHDAGVQVLLTNLDRGTFGVEGLRVVTVKQEATTDADDILHARMEAKPEDLAYIMYTSGSTGQPKGVMVQHRPLVNFLWSMRSRPGIAPHDVLLAVTSLSFDIAALELYLPLIVGATVVVADSSEATNPFRLAEALERHRVTIMQATPATWQMLIDAGWQVKTKLKALCGGEALSHKLANQLLERVDEVWNMYGPTETTIWSSAGRIRPGNHPIVIGQPVGNTSLHVLDRYLQPAPAGVTGELYIGGEGLALGYLHQPELTKEKFIPDPFSQSPGARLYQTGDLACCLEDGGIEILGRTDQQVKLHGNRIETEEIQSVLQQHPAIRQSLVILQTGPSREKRLVAYYAGFSDPFPGADELRPHLARKLPSYMIPAFFIRLDAFPLSPNGKTDRHALPLPEDVLEPTGYVAPRNRDEEMLATLWKEALGAPRVGIHDNFFDLGGASIQSLQVVAKANMLGLPMTVENLFEHQTIAELAPILHHQQEKGG